MKITVLFMVLFLIATFILNKTGVDAGIRACTVQIKPFFSISCLPWEKCQDGRCK